MSGSPALEPERGVPEHWRQIQSNWYSAAVDDVTGHCRGGGDVRAQTRVALLGPEQDTDLKDSRQQSLMDTGHVREGHSSW